MKIIRTAWQIRQCEATPRWYGIAWEEDYGQLKVLYPVTLNLVFGLVRAVWLRLKPGYRDRIVRAYRKGFEDGNRAALRALSPAKALGIMIEHGLLP